MDHVVLIIVHYSNEKDTRECLESLQDISHKGFQYTVLVVDNASKKPLMLPAKLQAKNVQVIRSEKNLGFTGGNNLGIWYAREHLQPTHLAFLNNDTLVEPKFLEELYETCKQDLQVGLVCPKIYFAKGREYHAQSYASDQKGSVFWYAGGSIDWANLVAFHKGVDEVDRGQFDLSVETDFATGCCMMMPLETIDRVGTLDKRYFLYLEDVDWSLRTKQAGYKVIYQPKAIVWHKNAGSSGGAGSPTHQYYQARNRLLLAWTHGAWAVRKIVLLLMWQFLRRGNPLEKRAVFDLIFGRLGKQLVV